METSEGPREDTLSTGVAAPTRLCEILLERFDDATAVFSEEPIHLTQPCTGTSSRACQVIHHLSTWNKMLFHANLELREQPRSRAGCTLASIDCPHVGMGTVQKLPTLLYLLLKKHHCITGLDIVVDRLKSYHAILYNALRDSEHIERIKLRGPIDSGSGFHIFFSVIPSLKNLKHFECTDTEELRQPPLDAISALMWTTKKLRALYIPHLWMTWMDSRDLFTAIAAYPFLKHLSLNCASFARQPLHCCDTFARYIRGTRTLATLRLRGECPLHVSSTKVVLQALCANKSILTLEMEKASVDEEAAELMASIFTQNNDMRRFLLPNLFQKLFISPHGYCDEWLQPLMENNVLEEVTLPVCMWRPEQWKLFFDVLSSKCSLKRVTLGLHDTHVRDLQLICNALRGTAAEEKVTFRPFGAFSCSADNLGLLQCKSIVDVIASSITGTWALNLESLVRELIPLGHVTSLTLFIPAQTANKSLSSAIADYIRETTTLKKLNLVVARDAFCMDDATIRWKTVAQSLSQNQSVTELRIETARMDTDEVEVLGDAVRVSDTIRRFCLWDPRGQLLAAFLKQLSRDIATNYSIVRVEFPKYTDRGASAVWDTARRNSSLVARASQFRRGAQLQRPNAVALERVCRHRALLGEFADVERISVEEAATALRASLRTLDGMHAFMRAAGVIDTSVVCHARQDGRVQLNDLNEDCWRAVRRYLMVDDVVTEASSACGPQ